MKVKVNVTTEDGELLDTVELPVNDYNRAVAKRLGFHVSKPHVAISRAVTDRLGVTFEVEG